MKKTAAPTVEEISAKYGEQYFTVSLSKHRHPIDAFVVYGSIEDIVSTMDATIYGVDPEAADLAAWSASISDDVRTLVTMPDCAGPDSARVHPQAIAEVYEIRQVDAWHDGEGWYYNETWKLGSFITAAADVPRAFRRALATMGIKCQPHATRTEYDGDVYEIVYRKTGAPLFCAIPQEV